SSARTAPRSDFIAASATSLRPDPKPSSQANNRVVSARRIICRFILQPPLMGEAVAELRNYRTGPRRRRSGPDHFRGSDIVVLADILEQLGSGSPAKQESAVPGCGISSRVIDGHFIFE